MSRALFLAVTQLTSSKYKEGEFDLTWKLFSWHKSSYSRDQAFKKAWEHLSDQLYALRHGKMLKAKVSIRHKFYFRVSAMAFELCQ